MKKIINTFHYFGLLLILTACSGFNETDDLLKKHNTKIEGRWKLLKMVQDGELSPESFLKENYFFFKKGRMWMGNKEQDLPPQNEPQLSFKLDPGAKPANLDITNIQNEKDPPVNGIYKFENDLLIICLPEKEGFQRPKDFTIKPSDKSKYMYIELILDK